MNRRWLGSRLRILAGVALVCVFGPVWVAHAGVVTTRVSVATGGGEGTGGTLGALTGPRGFSADGRYVAFSADLTNLVAGDNHGFHDVFGHDRMTGNTERVPAGGGAEPDNGSGLGGLSNDGRWVLIVTQATNYAGSPAGAFPADTNGFTDCYVHDRT